MDPAVFIETKFHDISPRGNWRIRSWVYGNRDGRVLTERVLSGLLQCQSGGDHDEPDWSSSATTEGKTARARRNRAAERGVDGPGKSRRAARKVQEISRPQDAEPYVSGWAQENRRGSARTLGKMEEEQAEQVNGGKRANRAAQMDTAQQRGNPPRETRAPQRSRC